jgi:hypothetical protein
MEAMVEFGMNLSIPFERFSAYEFRFDRGPVRWQGCAPICEGLPDIEA